MKNKHIIILFSVFLVCSIGICLYLNKKLLPVTYKEISENVSEVLIPNPQYPYEHRGYYTDKIYEDDIASLDKLYDASDLVAIVTPVSSRQESMVVKTEVDIKQIIYEGVDVSERITVFEQYYFDQEGRLNIDAGSTLPMKLNEEYLLFLKVNDDYPSGNVYRLTSIYYGKFPASHNLKIYENNQDHWKPYDKDVLNYDVAFVNVEPLLELLSSSSQNELADIEKKALLKYKDLYKETYLSFYNQLKNILQK